MVGGPPWSQRELDSGPGPTYCLLPCCVTSGRFSTSLSLRLPFVKGVGAPCFLKRGSHLCPCGPSHLHVGLTASIGLWDGSGFQRDPSRPCCWFSQEMAHSQRPGPLQIQRLKVEDSSKPGSEEYWPLEPHSLPAAVGGSPVGGRGHPLGRSSGVTARRSSHILICCPPSPLDCLLSFFCLEFFSSFLHWGLFLAL